VGLLGANPTAAVQDGCMEDVYQNFNGGGTLNCTANDIQIAGVTNVTILDDGCAFVGDTVTFDADVTVQLTAQARHDVGLYLATDGGDALTGSCLIETVPEEGAALITDLDGTGDNTKATDAFGYCSTVDNSSDPGDLVVPEQPCNSDSDCVLSYCEEFGAGITGSSPIQDTCGDIDDDPNPIDTAVTNLTILCLDNDNDGIADLPNCTSWRQPGDNDLCLSPLAAFPGAPSKCRCDVIDIDDIPVPKTLKVIKALTPFDDLGLFDLEIDSVTERADAGDGDATDPVVVDPGAHTVSESAGTGTILSA
jgi:hypothetical protein